MLEERMHFNMPKQRRTHRERAVIRLNPFPCARTPLGSSLCFFSSRCCKLDHLYITLSAEGKAFPQLQQLYITAGWSSHILLCPTPTVRKLSVCVTVYMCVYVSQCVCVFKCMYVYLCVTVCICVCLFLCMYALTMAANPIL